mgnify:CR=1
MCPVYIHGISNHGKRIKTHTVTDNISSGGLYLHTPQPLKLGSIVFTFTQLLSGARLAARGKVVRVETKGHSLPGLAVHFNRPRLFAAL